MGFPKPIYNKAYSILATRRQNAKEKDAAQRDAIYTAIPEIAKIDRTLAQTGMATIAAVAARPDDLDRVISQAKAQNLSLQARKKFLLESFGVPEEYLKVPYTCPLCEDTGYIGNRRCKCLEKLLRQIASEELGSTDLENFRFSNFSLDFYSKTPLPNGLTPLEHMAQVKNYCVEYAKTFDPRRSDSLLFMGGTGLGKTHLSLAIARQVIDSGHGVIYASMQNLLAHLESEHFTNSYNSVEEETEQSYLSMVLDTDLLILDDLGTEFLNQFVVSTIYNLINTRLIQHKPTIISTNLLLPEIGKRYSERLVSRLFGGYRRLDFVGKDIRIQNNLMG